MEDIGRHNDRHGERGLFEDFLILLGTCKWRDKNALAQMEQWPGGG